MLDCELRLTASEDGIHLRKQPRTRKTKASWRFDELATWPNGWEQYSSRDAISSVSTGRATPPTVSSLKKCAAVPAAPCSPPPASPAS